EDEAGRHARREVGGRALRKGGFRLRGVRAGGGTAAVNRCGIDGLGQGGRRLVQTGARLLVGGEQRLNRGQDFGPPRARLRQERGTLLERSGQRFPEQGFFGHRYVSECQNRLEKAATDIRTLGTEALSRAPRSFLRPRMIPRLYR